MKLNLSLLLAAVFCSPTLFADEHGDHGHKDDKKEGHKEHDHDHDKQAGPNGGRILHEVSPHAELFITAQRKVKITFVDENNKAIARKKQSLTMVCGDRKAPTKITFEKTPNGYLSTNALPKGNNVPSVIRIKTTPEAKAKTVRLNINLADCPTCEFKEYACTCDHGHDNDHGHDHKKK